MIHAARLFMTVLVIWVLLGSLSFIFYGIRYLTYLTEIAQIPSPVIVIPQKEETATTTVPSYDSPEDAPAIP